MTQYLHLPITNHTWVFLIVLAVILLAPMLFSKLRIPHLIGMILAGVLIGNHGLNLLERDSSFELFGKVGIYYIMFLAGLEMDKAGLKQNRRNGIIFGSLTSLIPFATGFAAGFWLLHLSAAASLLLACILTSHTLVSYPIVGRYNLSHHKSVSISVAATMIALLFALFVLAVLSGAVRGTVDAGFWLLFAVKFAAFAVMLFGIFPRVIRTFFRTFSDAVLQFIFVLTMMFLAAAVAEICGLEGILGAFLAGLVFNRFIPRSTPLMNRVEFVGNALFIPYFLIGVGMLVNLKPIFTSHAAQEVVLVMVIVGTASKYLAALISRKLFGLSRSSGLMMFGLSEAHAAGALAMVMVGTTLEAAPGVPLMDNSMLDGVVVMILISCIISSLSTDQAARMLKLEEEAGVVTEERTATDDEKILVPVNDMDNIPMLIQTAIMMRNAQLNRGLICLNVVNDDDTTGVLHRHSLDCLHEAERLCVAADVKIQLQSRLAVNFVNGVIHAFRENDASEIIIGLHHRQSPKDSLLGRFAQGLIGGLARQILILHYTIPVNTFRRIVVAVPARAQYEPGFCRWMERVARLAIEIGCRILFHATEETASLIQSYMNHYHPLLRDEYKPFGEDESLASLADEVNDDHLFVLVTARHGTISYEKRMNHLQQELLQHFTQKSFIIVYPDQEGEALSDLTFSEPHGRDVNNPSRLSRWLSKWISRIG